MGATGLELSQVGLGGVEVRGGDVSLGEPSLGEAVDAVVAAIERGINWLDTAEAYYERRNEAFLGRVLAELGDELLVASRVSPAPDGSGFRPEEVRAACAASLDRLGLEGENGDRSGALVDALRPIAQRLGATVPQLAIAWVLELRGVTSAIACSRNPEHVRQNAQAAELVLDAGVIDELERVIPLGPTV